MIPGFSFNTDILFFLIIYEDSLCFKKVYILRLSNYLENKWPFEAFNLKWLLLDTFSCIKWRILRISKKARVTLLLY